jgi:hypothetical protein
MSQLFIKEGEQVKRFLGAYIMNEHAPRKINLTK